MDYSFFVWSTASFIETRLKEKIEYSALEKTVGFSYRHIRETFKECTGITLSRYILLRKIANSAFDIVHTPKSLTEIAGEYMFDSYDTFTRAYKRHINLNPSEFRNPNCKLKVGRRRILTGFYAPMIMQKEEFARRREEWLVNTSGSTPQIMENDKSMKNVEKSNDSCILYGVPKVAYTFEECTPFCVAMKSCLNYMGQQIDYAYIMATTGAAFRLRWNINEWDGGNVDIMNIYENPYEAFQRAFQAAGRRYQLLKREDSSKEEFIQFIKKEIDDGRPVIAFGIIGPPEACLITGYRDGGNTLLGWNCFQENQEYAGNVKLDESGYFITSTWWENECTVALISVGEEQEKLGSSRDILENAIDILTKERITFRDQEKITAEYAGGQKAYEAWASSVGNDKEFPEQAVLPILFERLMCQNDAQVMICEGRSYAACYFDRLAGEHEAVADKCKKVAGYFRKVAECGFKMNDAKGGFMQDEAAARKFAEPQSRKTTVSLILKAKEYEEKACGLIKEILSEL